MQRKTLSKTGFFEEKSKIKNQKLITRSYVIDTTQLSILNDYI